MSRKNIPSQRQRWRRRLRRAFITAPTSVDTSILRDSLRRRGFDPYELDDVAGLGRGLGELLEHCVRDADLVVGFQGDTKEPDVFFALGYAFALKKRILLFVPPGAEVPFPEIPCLRTRPDNLEAVDFGLDLIVAVPNGRRPRRQKTHPTTKPLGALVDPLLDKIRAASQEPKPHSLTKLVLEALAACGIDAVAPSEPMEVSNGRAHFAIWADDFEPWIGNPVLVDVWSRLSSPAELEQALGQMLKNLEHTHMAWGLLLYCGPEFGSNVKATRHPKVFVFSVQRFVEALRDSSLGVFLSRMRKLRVHGRG